MKSNLVEWIFELLKIILPALIVFLAVYFVLKKFLNTQLQNLHIQTQADNRKSALKIRLQAYERLALYCERMDIPNLLLRLRTSKMTNAQLKNALMIAIQKEYEHNMVQQIYVSDNLWKIILLAKEYVQNLIIDSFSGIDSSGDSGLLSDQLIQQYNRQKINPINTSLDAIRKETELLFK